MGSVSREGDEILLLFMVEDRCRLPNYPAWLGEILKGVINHDGGLEEAGCSCVARKLSFSYICHNKLGNRIMCTCSFFLVTEQVLLLTMCVFCEILNIEK